MADISFNIACNKLKIAQVVWANQLFQVLNLVRIYGHSFFELTRTLLRKNVTNDVSNDSAIQFAFCFRQKLNYLSIPREFRFWPWLNLYITFYWMLIKMQKSLLNLIYAQMFVFFALMNVSSLYWSPFHANDCVFSRNEQQKVYFHMS